MITAEKTTSAVYSTKMATAVVNEKRELVGGDTWVASVLLLSRSPLWTRVQWVLSSSS